MPLVDRSPRFWLGLVLSAVLSCMVMTASADDAAGDAEVRSLRDSTRPADILRVLQLRYPDQPDTWHEFWASVTVEGLKAVTLGANQRGVTHERLFLVSLRMMAEADARSNPTGGHNLDRMIDQGILKADSPFVSRLRPIVEEIDRKGHARIAELDERIQQADERIQQEREKQQQYRRLSEMLKSFESSR